MFDAKSLLDQLVGSGAAGGFAGGLAGGAVANVLSGKKGRKMAGSALKLGGLALVGGLAYKAWKNHQQGAGQPQPQSPGAVELPPTGSAFLPREDDGAGTAALSLLLARAMIAAAKADGQIDTQESQTILNQINGLDLPADDKAFLFEEYGRPLDIAGLARDVDSPEHAAEVYTAAVLMVEPPSPPERIFLNTLANALGLETGLVQQIQATVAANRPG
ncbi:tellurite resistance TerB family protein [Thioalkalivibrio sp.]|uniref:tellurite resistance TerB family protein n=1 Tax=Thioalkalivibrio sp. TaxID=2093813 RepID=UPI003975CF08